MRLRNFTAISVAVAAAAGFACGSFGEGSDESPPDRGTEDAGLDVEVDSAPHDAVADAGARRRCEGKVLLEERFDPDAAVGNGWSASPDAGLSLVNAGPSPPALYGASPILTAGDEYASVLSRTFALGTDTKVCIELDVNLELMGGAFSLNAYAEVLSVRSNSGGPFFVEMIDKGLVLTQETTVVPIAGFTYGQWRHLVLEMPFGSGAPASITLDDGAAQPSPSPAGPVAATVSATIGLEASAKDGTTAALRVHIDNFRLTTAR